MANLARINYGSLEHNIKEVKKTLPDGVRIAAVIKGNAYGHGLIKIARALDMNPDVCLLVTASINEAM